jgi:predicted methyltransferase
VRLGLGPFFERYPYAEQLTLAIIGEDDFLSRYTVNDSRFETVVLEKDQTILTTLRGLWQSKKLHIYDIDIPSSYEKLGLPRAATFITDPPYTLHGALAFIVCGLSMLVYDETSEVEFYVILNASMMGRHLDELTSILSVAGVHLRGVIEDFSAYELPGHFPERKRADQFLQSLGLNTKMNYSSSSNLYRFACSAPDIAKLTKLIDAQRMYEHYSRD